MLKRLVLAASFAASSPSPLPARAQDTIKIGEINSYKAQPAFLEPVQEGLGARGRGGQRRRRRARQEAAGDLARRQRQPGRRGARRRGAGLARRRGADRRHVPLEHRPRGHRLRQAEEGVLPRRRAAHRQDHLAERQPLHLPPAPEHLHAVGDAGARGGQAEEEALGRRLSELRVRPVGGGDLQGDAEEAAARRRVPARPGDAARPHRGRRGGAGARRRQARRDLQRAVRRRPVEVRARGQHPRSCSRAARS